MSRLLSTSTILHILILACIAIVTLQTSLAQTPTDPCATVCCSRGWNFYGEGNFSKLGVNGSSDCNCFDTLVTKCPSAQFEGEEQELFAMSSAARRPRDMEVSAAPVDHCLTACCTVGHVYYGYGDYARLETCNCAMQAPMSCNGDERP